MTRIEDLEALRAARADRRAHVVVADPLPDIGAGIGDRRCIDRDRPGEGRARA